MPTIITLNGNYSRIKTLNYTQPDLFSKLVEGDLKTIPTLVSMSYQYDHYHKLELYWKPTLYQLYSAFV